MRRLRRKISRKRITIVIAKEVPKQKLRTRLVTRRFHLIKKSAGIGWMDRCGNVFPIVEKILRRTTAFFSSLFPSFRLYSRKQGQLAYLIFLITLHAHRIATDECQFVLGKKTLQVPIFPASRDSADLQPPPQCRSRATDFPSGLGHGKILDAVNILRHICMLPCLRFLLFHIVPCCHNIARTILRVKHRDLTPSY